MRLARPSEGYRPTREGGITDILCVYVAYGGGRGHEAPTSGREFKQVNGHMLKGYCDKRGTVGQRTLEKFRATYGQPCYLLGLQTFRAIFTYLRKCLSIHKPLQKLEKYLHLFPLKIFHKLETSLHCCATLVSYNLLQKIRQNEGHDPLRRERERERHAEQKQDREREEGRAREGDFKKIKRKCET